MSKNILKFLTYFLVKCDQTELKKKLLLRRKILTENVSTTLQTGSLQKICFRLKTGIKKRMESMKSFFNYFSVIIVVRPDDPVPLS